MTNSTKWLISIVFGIAATFFEQYGLFFLFVCAAIVFDCVTGLIKAKVIGEGLTSKKGFKGFWKKLGLLVGLSFGIYLDYAVPLLFARAGITLGVELPFALIICCYIVLNESISICENLYAINPSIMPGWIVKLLKGGKERIDSREQGKEKDETKSCDE